jgi:uncharacterized protein YecE (DUF72 family)
VDVLIGTSGFSYAPWKGLFYPEKIPQKDMLAFYATKLPTVEINNTFYRLPAAAMLEGWASQVPAHFRFAIKASQRITHQQRLKDCKDTVDYLYNTLSVLGERRGPVLFQTPPNLKRDVPRLADFLAMLPEGHRAAFEFRNEGWYQDEVYELLRKHGAVLAISETDSLVPPVISTADWGYLRLRLEDYSDAQLAAWAETIKAQSAWKQVFVYFMHEDNATGPRWAAQLRDLVNARS